MSAAMNAVRLRAAADRRHAIMESWIGGLLAIMTCILAAQGQAWHAAGSALAAGALLSAAGFTAIRALTWKREADKREGAR